MMLILFKLSLLFNLSFLTNSIKKKEKKTFFYNYIKVPCIILILQNIL